MPLDDYDRAQLWDMLQAAEECIVYMKGVERSEYLDNNPLRRAVERLIEIIGEAARGVSPAAQAANPSIPWSRIIGQRHVLAHDYGEIDHDRLYKVASGDVQILAAQLREILRPDGLGQL
jgi:uncharacterized protein with HEPN domain